jgi:hypothetical protein
VTVEMRAALFTRHADDDFNARLISRADASIPSEVQVHRFFSLEVGIGRPR